MKTNDKVEAKLVKHLVDRFLGWHLPKDFHPDGGIMFMDVYDNGTEQGGKFEPTGTNLFTAAQATEMFRFLLEHEDGTSFLTTHEREVLSEYENRKGWKGYVVVDPETDNYSYSNVFFAKKEADKKLKDMFCSGLEVIEVDIYPVVKK